MIDTAADHGAAARDSVERIGRPPSGGVLPTHREIDSRRSEAAVVRACFKPLPHRREHAFMIRLPVLLLIAIACSATPASAQTMYRCGSTFQDHPCGGGQVGQAIGTNSGQDAARTSPASSKLGAECAQRGTAAQKIKWMREAGKTQQDQAAGAGREQQDLIADVYRRQGSSVQVRSAIEEDCMAEQERNAQAAALVKAENRLKAGNGSPGDSRNNDGVATAPNVAPSPVKDNASSNAAAAKKATCQQLNSQLDEVRSMQRAGGDVHGMEALRKQALDIGNKLRTTGC